MLVTRRRLVLVLLGLTLSFSARAGGQNPEHRIALRQSPASPTLVSPPGHALPLTSSVLLIQRQGQFHDGYSFRITANYRLQDADSLFPFHETKTLFATESRVPVAQIWGARLQVNFFAVTLYTRNVMLGPLASNEALPRPRQLRSVDLYGIGVSVPLGRDARWEDSKRLWASLSRIVHGNGWPRLSFNSPQDIGGPVPDCSSLSVGEERGNNMVFGGEQELTTVTFPNQEHAPPMQRDCE
jgi:hypothetical protein